MGVAVEQGDLKNLIRLDGSVDISCAAELKTALVEALGCDKDVNVSLEAASYLDVTAVQLLSAADREARNRGVRVILSGPCPEGLRQSLAQAGMADLPLISTPA